MKLDGMPVACATRSAAAPCWDTKPLWLALGLTTVEAAGSDTVGRLPRASPVIFCDSWRVMASVRPPGMPESWTENCWSSRSVPSFSPSLSIRPDFMVASRMLLSSSRMNSDSNCLAASLTAFGSLVPAASLSASSDRASAASALPLLAGSELDDMDEMVMP